MMFDNGPLGFFAVTPMGRITYLSAAAAAMTGLSVGDWAWKSIRREDRRPLCTQVQSHGAARGGLSLDITVVNHRAQIQTSTQLQLFPTQSEGDRPLMHVGVLIDVTRRNLREENLRHQARHDPLTRLMNRRACLDELNRRLRDRRHADSVSVLYFDLDRFKDVNDAFGHEAGDELLRTVADRLRAGVREGDEVGRIGGDEFIVISTAGPAGDDALALARRLQASVIEPFCFGEITLNPMVSIGVALQRNGEVDAERLIGDADLAMYDAKSNGSGARSVLLASADNRENLERRMRISVDFESAWTTGDIGFAYQPIRNLASGATIGAEAFLRWRHPTLGLIPPNEFMKIAEASPSLGQFTTWCLETICREWAWLREREPAFRSRTVSMNVSARQLSLDGYAKAHVDATTSHGLRSEDVILELQEWTPGATRHVEASSDTLAASKIPVVLDYFGVGYNALEFVQRLPVLGFKIAPSLTRSLTDSRTSAAVVRGLLVTAQELGLFVCGEGIESEAQLEAARDLGVTLGQGHALGRPVPIKDFAIIESEIGNSSLDDLLTHFGALQ